MATVPRPHGQRTIEYPESDGKPFAETETHARDMIDLFQALRAHFDAEPDVYVWGNLLLFYEEGDPRKVVSPDVFVVRGVPKDPPRRNYLVWKEGKAPDLVIEITSKKTRANDVTTKKALYQDVLKVPEYFLFDPYQEYLKPPMQGYRLVGGEYEPIAPVEGRLPSEVLGLYLERDGTALRLYHPASGRRLLTPQERAATAEAKAEAEAHARRRAEAQTEQLRREIEALERRLGGSG